MNLCELIPSYLRQKYPNQIVAIKFDYDTEFDVITIEKGKEFEFYCAVADNQWPLYDNGKEFDRGCDGIAYDESVIHFIKDLELKKKVANYIFTNKYTGKMDVYWAARITGKNKFVKYNINFRELGF